MSAIRIRSTSVEPHSGALAMPMPIGLEMALQMVRERAEVLAVDILKKQNDEFAAADTAHDAIPSDQSTAATRFFRTAFFLVEDI